MSEKFKIQHLPIRVAELKERALLRIVQEQKNMCFHIEKIKLWKKLIKNCAHDWNQNNPG